MKIFSLFLLLASAIGYCVFVQIKAVPVEVAKKEQRNKLTDSGIKWNDSLWNHLPEGIDTNIIVKDSQGNSFKFSQYVKPVFNHEAIIFRDKDVWRLHRLTDESLDSLTKDEYAVAARDRRDASRNPDTVTSWMVKLDNLSKTLAQADHILVLKAKHKMLVSRKGRLVKSFNINMGKQPIGNKVEEGDGKTPEGIYNVDGKYLRGDRFYKSYLISYPNTNDKLLAKKRGVTVGSGVSIHGTPSKKNKSLDWTAGCIAMQNKDLDELFNLVGNGTTIEIRK